MKRREFLSLAVAAGAVSAGAGAQPRAAFKAVAFDAFPIFDPRPLAALAEEVFPGKGTELIGAWRARQFEYQWLRALSGQYADFWRTTADSLAFAADLVKLDLTPSRQQRLMQAYLELNAWPDVVPSLSALRGMGLRLALLSNATPAILEAGIRNAKLDGLFEHVLSTDAVRSYKPDPRAYRLGVDALKVAREDILFAAFAGWDAAGARAFGYPTFWVNRLGLPAERLGAVPDGSGRGLDELVAFVRDRRAVDS